MNYLRKVALRVQRESLVSAHHHLHPWPSTLGHVRIVGCIVVIRYSAAMEGPAIRLYLDTAVILDIADGTLPRAEIEALHAAMVEHSAGLVLSLGHLWDLRSGRGVDRATEQRWCNAIEGFSSVWMVRSSPLKLEEEALLLAEQQRPTGRDAPMPADLLSLAPVDSAEDLLRSLPWQIGPVLRMAGPMMAVAETLSRRADSKSTRQLLFGLEKFPRTARALDWMTRHTLGLPIETFVRQMNKKNAVGLSSAPVRAITFRGGFEAWLAVAREVAPGQYLHVMLTRRKQQDLKRVPLGSDLADGYSHAAVLPYVDTATVDATNFAVLDIEAKKARCPRLLRLLKNPGQKSLAPIVAALGDIARGRK